MQLISVTLIIVIIFFKYNCSVRNNSSTMRSLEKLEQIVLLSFETALPRLIHRKSYWLKWKPSKNLLKRFVIITNLIDFIFRFKILKGHDSRFIFLWSMSYEDRWQGSISTFLERDWNHYRIIFFFTPHFRLYSSPTKVKWWDWAKGTS